MWCAVTWHSVRSPCWVSRESFPLAVVAVGMVASDPVGWLLRRDLVRLPLRLQADRFRVLVAHEVERSSRDDVRVSASLEAQTVREARPGGTWLDRHSIR
jgi:transcriptional regulator with AAA-type ATPase domain